MTTRWCSSAFVVFCDVNASADYVVTVTFSLQYRQWPTTSQDPCYFPNAVSAAMVWGYCALTRAFRRIYFGCQPFRLLF